jgi:hypothetical protein
MRKRRPEIISVGSFTARLYRAKKVVGGKAYPIFRLTYFEPEGRRRVRDFPTEAKALPSPCCWGSRNVRKRNTVRRAIPSV